MAKVAPFGPSHERLAGKGLRCCRNSEEIVSWQGWVVNQRTALTPTDTSRRPRERKKGYLGRDPETGKKQYLSPTFRTKKEAERWRLERQKEHKDTGTVFEPSEVPLGQYLKEWLKTIEPNVRPATWAAYEVMVRKHIAPDLGRVPLCKLTPATVQKFYNQQRERVSSRVLQYVHATLHRALEQAVRLDLIRQNPCQRVEKPKHKPKEQLTEISGKLVFQEPKTKAGKRSIPLLPEAVEALKRHRLEQKKERLLAGPEWADTGLCFTAATGKPLHPNNLVKRDFRKLLQEAGLPPIRFHDLRHSVATALLAQGVHPKVAQALLGHSQGSVTMNVYSHVLPSMAQEAAQHLRSVLPDKD